MDQLIKAVPTSYNRINFRSRSEARYAVFFDLVGIKWQYEPEKKFTGVSRYIPDFLIQYGDNKQAYFEVKGTKPTMAEYSKLANVVGDAWSEEETHGFIAHGPVSDLKIEEVRLGSSEPLAIHTTELLQCPFCGVIGFDTNDSQDTYKHQPCLVPHQCRYVESIAETFDVDPIFLEFCPDYRIKKNPVSPILSLASEWAQNARFEDPNFYETLEDKKKTLRRLGEMGAVADTLFIKQFHLYVLLLKMDYCPRWVPPRNPLNNKPINSSGWNLMWRQVPAEDTAADCKKEEEGNADH